MLLHIFRFVLEEDDAKEVTDFEVKACDPADEELIDAELVPC